MGLIGKTIDKEREIATPFSLSRAVVAIFNGHATIGNQAFSRDRIGYKNLFNFEDVRSDWSIFRARGSC